MISISNKKGFTLIEILITVMIIALFATVIFNISQKNKTVYSFLDRRLTIFLPASILFNTNFTEDKEVFLLDELSKKYPNIDNEELREILKEQKYKLRYERDESGLFFLVDTLSVDINGALNSVYSFRILDIGLDDDLEGLEDL